MRLGILLVSGFCLFTAIPIQNSFAHWGKFGPIPEPLSLEVVVKSIQLNPGFNYDYGKEEIVLEGGLEHGFKGDEHGEDSFSRQWHWDTDNGGTKKIADTYTHYECAPQEPIHIWFIVVESDTSWTETAISIAAGGIGFAVSFTLWTFFVSGPVTIWVALLFAVIGIGASIAGQLNDDDPVGIGRDTIAGAGEYNTKLINENGAVAGTVYYDIIYHPNNFPLSLCSTPVASSADYRSPSRSNVMINEYAEKTKQAYAYYTNEEMIQEKGEVDKIIPEDVLRDNAKKRLLKQMDLVLTSVTKNIKQFSTGSNQKLLATAQGHLLSNEYDTAFEKYSQLLLELETQTAVPTSIAPWIKNIALWWSQGIIGDQNYALAMGYLVIERIIPVGAESLDPTGTLRVSENLSISPSIKQNAGLWAKGQISDNAFISDIQSMSAQIISLSEPISTASEIAELEAQKAAAVAAVAAAQAEAKRLGEQVEVAQATIAELQHQSELAVAVGQTAEQKAEIAQQIETAKEDLETKEKEAEAAAASAADAAQKEAQAVRAYEEAQRAAEEAQQAAEAAQESTTPEETIPPEG